jgi:hypothetical protein
MIPACITVTCLQFEASRHLPCKYSFLVNQKSVWVVNLRHVWDLYNQVNIKVRQIISPGDFVIANVTWFVLEKHKIPTKYIPSLVRELFIASRATAVQTN